MLRCCLCQLLGASAIDHDEDRLEHMLDHAVIHKSQINRFDKTNIFKVFADCFPNIAADYTVREMVDSMETSQNSVTKDDTEGKASSVSAKNAKKAPQCQGMVLVKHTEKWSRIHEQQKHTGERRPPKSSIYLQCLRILEASCDKNQRRFQCGLCDDLVVLRTGPHAGLRAWCAIGHVLSHHLDIEPFRCRYCDHTTKHRSSMGNHVKRVHQALGHRSMYFINEINAHKKEIREMVETCFGRKRLKASKNESLMKMKITKQYKDTTLVADDGNQSPTYDGKTNQYCEQQPKILIHDQCRKILEASCDKDQRRFQCGVCDIPVVLRAGQNNALDTWNAISHVLSYHMDIKPFRCRYCDHMTKNRSSMGSHVKLTHQTPDRSSVYYINEVDAHQTEICEMVEACFGKKQRKSSENGSQAEIKVTGEYKDTTLVADGGDQSATCNEKRNHSHGPSMIGAHCRQTVAPYSRNQLHFECGECSKLIALRSGPKAMLQPLSALHHALAHMSIKPFRCRYCAVATKRRNVMWRHVENVHDLEASSTVHYIDEMSVHEKDICEMITKCFGKKDQLYSGTTSQ